MARRVSQTACRAVLANLTKGGINSATKAFTDDTVEDFTSKIATNLAGFFHITQCDCKPTLLPY
jgi:hypothetical protein